MRIVFDPRKDESNSAKHGVSLALAAELDWEEARIWLDDRREYGEMRMIALVAKSTILYYVASSTEGQYAASSVCGARIEERSNTMSVSRKKTPIELPSVAESRRITAAARKDPDAQPLTDAQLKAMVPVRPVRGRPRSESKKLLVSVRYSPEVLAYFRSTGEGWQARMDGVLRQYVQEHSRQS